MAGDLSFQQATDILNCLDYEDSYVVWKAAFTGFDLLKTDGAAVVMSKQLYNIWKVNICYYFHMDFQICLNLLYFCVFMSIK